MKLTTITVSAGFILIVAILLNIGQLYLMAGMLAAIPIVCYWVGQRQRGGLSAQRTLPATASEGEVVSVTLELSNQDRWPKPHLLAADHLPSWLVREGGPVPVSVDASGSATVTYTLRPEKRGYYDVGPVEVIASDPLGIFQFKTELPVKSPLVVYPSPEALPWFFMPGGSPFGASPLHSAEMRGEGSEFYGIREYQPGDPLRRVHWRSSARMGRLAVVEYEHDVSVEVILLLDTQKGSEVGEGKETTLEYGVRIAASIAHVAASKNDVVRLVAPGYAVWQDPGLRGIEALHVAMEALARVQADQPFSMAETLGSHADFFRRDAFVAVITSAATEELLTAIAGLSDRGVKIAVIFVDPGSFAGGEAKPDFREQLVAAGARACLVRRGLPLSEQFMG